MIIHLVRHGLPKIGSDGLYLPNAGLTELGHRQASLAAGKVVRLKPDASFTSDVPRAIESAAHFEQATNQNVRQIPNLAELKTGDIWAAPDSIIKRISQGDYHVEFKSMGGETITEFSHRAIEGFSELLHIASTSRLNRIAAFLHEGVIGTIIDHLEGRSIFDPKRRITMPYGALITVDTETNAPHFPGYWETDHLD
ncbi:MAG: histidine phosphatase family protein [Chloroflexi bacterium]|jgi:probable phosphoglycerate mutase|nr:histidine phosphatase family protein [Chloroflexota bacterium]